MKAGTLTSRGVLGLSLGALCPPISEQLKEQGLKLDKKDLKLFQQDVHELLRLHIRGYLTDTGYNHAAEKLMKSIAKAVKSL